jgi:ATP-dependent DNA ligase
MSIIQFRIYNVGLRRDIRIQESLEPDVWVEPKVVFTVEADEITKKKDSKYLSLRFPRLIEWGRGLGECKSSKNFLRQEVKLGTSYNIVFFPRN